MNLKECLMQACIALDELWLGMFDESDMLLGKTSMPAIADWLLECLLSHLTRSTSIFNYTLPYVPIFRKQSSVSIVNRYQRMVAKFASIFTSS